MHVEDLEKYIDLAVKAGASNAKIIHPSTVVTARWVRWKCQYGCRRWRKSYCCPPESPTPEQTRSVLDTFQRAILFHRVLTPEEFSKKTLNRTLERMVDLEEALFKDGYYKAFIITSGPCQLCEECAILKSEPCKFSNRTRPSMEACGIDVYQTARNNGFQINPLKNKEEDQDRFGVILVD